MARKTGRSVRVPKYCRQKVNGQPDRAYVSIDGQRHYLGPYGSDESRERYASAISEWSARQAEGRPLETAKSAPESSVAEAVLAFWGWADRYYRREDGEKSGELDGFRVVLRRLTSLYGRTDIAVFVTFDAKGRADTTKYKAVRQALIDAGHARTGINRSMSRLRTFFRWLVEEGFVAPAVPQALDSVRPLKKGRTEARESDPVRPACLEDVEATIPFLSAPLAIVVQILLFTGARSGEILSMRPADIDRSSDVWLYRVRQHKGTHRGQERAIPLGPRAQRALEPLLRGRGPSQFVFSPREAEAERRASRHAERKTPPSCGNTPGSSRKARPKREPGDRYQTKVFGRAIRRAAKQAGVAHWSPHMLRHARATELRARYGIEDARACLGHALGGVATTEIYAERDLEAAKRVAREVG